MTSYQRESLPPFPDFSPGALLETAVGEYWLSLAVLVVCILLERTNRGKEFDARWLGLPLLVHGFLASVRCFESFNWIVPHQIFIWHEFAVATFGFALIAIPIATIALGRSRRQHIDIRSFVGPGAAVLAPLVDYLLFLLVVTDISAWSLG